MFDTVDDQVGIPLTSGPDSVNTAVAKACQLAITHLVGSYTAHFPSSLAITPTFHSMMACGKRLKKLS